MPGSRVLGGGAGGAETRSRERLREHHSHRGSGTTLHVTLLSPILEFCFSGILLGTAFCYGYFGFRAWGYPGGAFRLAAMCRGCQVHLPTRGTRCSVVRTVYEDLGANDMLGCKGDRVV
jgi:hypothetical protein